jgi:RNA polymerase sigma-70 factor (ECF subfamily)
MQVTAQVVQFPDSAARAAAEEREAVVAAARGDARAFERLYRLHAPRLFGLCLRLTRDRAAAEDAVQEAFISAWRALAGFEARSSFSTWIHRIAVNAVLVRRRGLAFELETTVDAELDSLDRRGTDATPAVDLEAAITALPDGARHVLVLVGLYGFTHEEAAESLGIAIGTSKAQLHRARRLLATRLGLDPEEA